MSGAEPSPALREARERFVDGLPRKAGELMTSVEQLHADPRNERARDELRRRLHALFASAQVFAIEGLGRELKDAIQRVDALRELRREPTVEEWVALRALARSLPDLGRGRAHGAAVDPVPALAPADRDEVAAPRRAVTEPAAPASVPKTPVVPVPDTPPPLSRKPSVVTILGEAAAAVDSPPAPAETEPRLPEGSGILGMLGASHEGSERPRVPTLRGIPSVSAPAPELALGDAPARFAAPTEAPELAAPRPPVSTEALAPHPRPRSVCAVLLVDPSGELASVPIVLPTHEFEVTLASSVSQALDAAVTSIPDVIVLDEPFLTAHGKDLFAELRRDPLLALVPVVCVVPSGARPAPEALDALGADASIERPLDPDQLARLLLRVTGLAAIPGPAPSFGSMTVDEVAAHVAAEVRRGLGDAAAHGHELRVDLGSGAEVMAATWAAVARIRKALRDRSGGRLAFRDELPGGGPRVAAIADNDPEAPDALTDAVVLAGRRVLVVDDDPAVRETFRRLLETAGAEVRLADNGAQALADAELARPDLIVSDILMPELDGLGLCRALEASADLFDVPVVLLSWKPDLFARMRDLAAGASGYVTKEAGETEVLRVLRRALWPRERLATELRQGHEVRGRVEDVGLRVLLRSVARRRSRAKVHLRTPEALFECELRGGRLLSVTTTRHNEEPVHGEDALRALIRARVGRFSVDARSDREGRLSDAVRVGMTTEDPILRRFLATVEVVVEPTDTEYDGPVALTTLKPGVAVGDAVRATADAVSAGGVARAPAPAVQPSTGFYVIMVLFCFVIGYVLTPFVFGASESRIDPQTGAPLGRPRGLSAPPAGSPAPSEARARPVPGALPAAAASLAAAKPTAAPVASRTDGELVAGIPDGLRVGATEGVLAIGDPAGAVASVVRVGGRPLGTTPLTAVLPAGVHAVEFERGDDLRIRVWYIEAGATRRVLAP